MYKYCDSLKKWCLLDPVFIWCKVYTGFQKSPFQGSQKRSPGCLGQVGFAAGQGTFHSHLPNGQGPRQVVWWLIQNKVSKLRLDQGKQNLRATCLNCKVEFKIFSNHVTWLYSETPPYGHPVITCGFPLAEERKKRKMFFSHMVGSLGTGVWGVSGHVACVTFQFLFCHPPLPDMPHLPIREVLVECVKLRLNYSLATFLCHCKTIMFSC